MKTLFKMNATWFCILLFNAMTFSIQTLLGDSFLNQLLRWNWIFSGKSDTCTYKSLLSHLQDVAVVLWLIWGCFSGKVQRIIQRKALFCWVWLCKAGEQGERLCVMSDEKGMEANRCHGVGHWEVRLTASTGSAKVQLHNIRQISKTAMERETNEPWEN